MASFFYGNRGHHGLCVIARGTTCIRTTLLLRPTRRIVEVDGGNDSFPRRWLKAGRDDCFVCEIVRTGRDAPSCVCVSGSSLSVSSRFCGQMFVATWLSNLGPPLCDAWTAYQLYESKDMPNLGPQVVTRSMESTIRLGARFAVRAEDVVRLISVIGDCMLRLATLQIQGSIEGINVSSGSRRPGRCIDAFAVESISGH